MMGCARSAERGAFVVVVGPDGSGKTTLARALVAASPTPVCYFHFRPALRGPLADRPPDAPAVPAAKTPCQRPGDRIRGWLRLVRSAGHCVLAYWLKIRPATRRGKLVFGDRWIFGYLTQPAPLRYYGPEWLARVIIRLVPEPSITVNLTAPVPVLLARKRELTADELAAELAANRTLPVTRLVNLSSEQPPAALATQLLKTLAAFDFNSDRHDTAR